MRRAKISRQLQEQFRQLKEDFYCVCRHPWHAHDGPTLARKCRDCDCLFFVRQQTATKQGVTHA